jgi:WD40 repeat protein
MAWHPDGKRLLCSGWLVTIWDREKSSEVARGNTRGECVAWNPDGETCIAVYGGDDNPACLTRLSADLISVLASTGGMRLRAEALAWSPDGQRLASGSSYYGPARLWDEQGAQQRCWTEPELFRPGRLAWRPDGKMLLAGDARHVWSVEGAAPPRKIYSSDKLYWGGSVAFSPDGQYAAFGKTNGYVQIVDAAGQEIAEMATGGTNHAFVAWHHGTNRIAVTMGGRPLMLCDPAKGWTLQAVGSEPLHGHPQPPIWSPEGQLLSISGNGWFDAEGKRVADTSRVDAHAWRPDGKAYAWVGGTYYLGLYARSGELKQSRVVNGACLCCAWHPRGHLIATGQAQSTITAWTAGDLQPYWHAVLLPEGKAATFSAAGELISGNAEEVDPYLVYYVEREDGKIETLTPAEFRQLLPPEKPQAAAARATK